MKVNFIILFLRGRIIEKKQRVNQEITSDNIMLIDEKGQPLGVVNIDQAKLLAFEKNLDLVEVGANAHPPVVKIMDFGKFIYEKEKQAQKSKSKQKGGETKEITLSVNINKHDLEVKVKRAKEFFEEGNKVIVSVRLKGREHIFADRAKDTIEEFKNLANAKFEDNVKRQGSRVSAIIKSNQ